MTSPITSRLRHIFHVIARFYGLTGNFDDVTRKINCVFGPEGSRNVIIYIIDMLTSGKYHIKCTYSEDSNGNPTYTINDSRVKYNYSC